MARKRVLSPLLALLVVVAIGFMFFVVPVVFERPCPEPKDLLHGSSPAPSPGPGPGPVAAGEESAVCQRAPRAVLLRVCCAVCFAAAVACVLFCCCQRFADKKGEASTAAAKKAGYVGIADGLEAGTAGEGGGKN